MDQDLLSDQQVLQVQGDLTLLFVLKVQQVLKDLRDQKVQVVQPHLLYLAFLVFHQFLLGRVTLQAQLVPAGHFHHVFQVFLADHAHLEFLGFQIHHEVPLLLFGQQVRVLR